MKVLHIQDAWEIPEFVQEIAQAVREGFGNLIVDVTEDFADDTYHFAVCHKKPTKEEIKAFLAKYHSDDDEE